MNIQGHYIPYVAEDYVPLFIHVRLVFDTEASNPPERGCDGIQDLKGPQYLLGVEFPDYPHDMFEGYASQCVCSGIFTGYLV